MLDLLFALGLTFVLVIPYCVVFLPLLLAVEEGSAAYDRLIATAGTLCYFTAYVLLEWFLLVRRDGQTLGKGLMGLRVVPTDDRRVLTLGSALVRLLMLFVPFVLFSLAGESEEQTGWDVLAYVGIAVVLASLVLAVLRRGSVHDLVARSRVVRAPRRSVALKADFMMAVPRPGGVNLTKQL